MRHTRTSAENREPDSREARSLRSLPSSPRPSLPSTCQRRGREVKLVGALAPRALPAEGWSSACAGCRPWPARDPGTPNLNFNRSLGDSRARRRSRRAGGGPTRAGPVFSERSYDTIKGRRCYFAFVNYFCLFYTHHPEVYVTVSGPAGSVTRAVTACGSEKCLLGGFAKGTDGDGAETMAVGHAPPVVVGAGPCWRLQPSGRHPPSAQKPSGLLSFAPELAGGRLCAQQRKPGTCQGVEPPQ